MLRDKLPKNMARITWHTVNCWVSIFVDERKRLFSTSDTRTARAPTRDYCSLASD